MLNRTYDVGDGVLIGITLSSVVIATFESGLPGCLLSSVMSVCFAWFYIGNKVKDQEKGVEPKT